MAFSYNPLMAWNTHDITDHNRSELEVANDAIENKQRMVNGTMRKYYVTTKRTFSCSWDMLPKAAAKTVGGFWGGDDIVNFYETTKGAFTLLLTDADTTTESVQVMFSDFSKTIVKRAGHDYWNISVTLEEV